MPAGRPKTPTAIKKHQGTYRPDREIENEMMPSKLAFAPSAPLMLSAAAKKMWESACAELAELEMLHRVDLELIATYCSEMDGYWKTVIQIQEKGTTVTSYNKNGDPYEIQSPLVAIKNSYFNNAKAIAIQLGFTPAARTKIAAPPAEREGSFEALINSDADDE